MLERIDPVPPEGEHLVEQPLYEVTKKIYPRAVTGWFAGWRWTLVWITQLIYYGVPWLSWNGRQAVLFDLAGRKFFVFGYTFWPQDFVYLTGLLVVAALSLFLFTAVAGRLWCGYACPQTVYTEIFLWVERAVEGDRNSRMRLDQEKAGVRKLGLKATKHAIWIAIAFWTGFTFVGYFTPVRELWTEAVTLRLGHWEIFWILFYGFATYGNAGWMREQVCKYMCPYARFQSAMFDPDTLIITYDPHRGELRGSRARNIDRKALSLGDCVDCGICVQVCPTGIDIRDGLQYECIGCAACIDGCNQVMDRFGYNRGLIRYSTETAMARQWTFGQMAARVFRPRVLVYTGILCAAIAAIAASLWLRVPLKVDVIRDRVAIPADDEDDVENVYRLQIINTDEQPHRFVISATGLTDMHLLTEPQPIEVGAASSRMVAVRLRADLQHGRQGSNKIEFVIKGSDDENHLVPEIFTVREKAVFIIPDHHNAH